VRFVLERHNMLNLVRLSLLALALFAKGLINELFEIDWERTKPHYPTEQGTSPTSR